MAATAREVAEARDPGLEPAEQVDPALRALLDRLLVDRDVARFALIEIYAGGPAALAAIAEEERRLQSALRGCLDRRARQVPSLKVAAIVAATLRCARMQLIDAPPDEARRTTATLIDWRATSSTTGRSSASRSALPPRTPRCRRRRRRGRAPRAGATKKTSSWRPSCGSRCRTASTASPRAR
jgi:hypothetical protein